ncbi:MAG TPA: rhodanese-like domain-containing protein [Blastocatellia bacterium]|nr:rhodanese-like domain-containing protein [Blastocatellia bacterium]
MTLPWWWPFGLVPEVTPRSLAQELTAVSPQLVDVRTPLEFEQGHIAGAVNVPAVSAEALQTVQPYLTLGEKLGSFQAQYFTQPVSEVQIAYNGEVTELDLRPITQAILAGLLKGVSSRVNPVNASVIAEERGLRITESKATTAQDFTSLIEVIVKNDKQQSRVAGTLFGKGEARIVAIDSYRLDAAPEGQLLILQNADQPGVVGRVGTFLGNHSINIAQLYLSRNKAGGTALAVYQVDSALSAATLTELAKSEHVISVKQISL